MKKIYSIFPLIYDVKQEYIRYRRRGESREQAVDNVLKGYHRELSDTDDAPQIWIGLANVMASKCELTADYLKKAELAFKELLFSYPEINVHLQIEMNRICRKELLGPEAKYSLKRNFDPKWEIGDTFAYRLYGEYPRKYGLDGYYILLRKINTILDDDGNLKQQLYLTLCTADFIPKTTEQLEHLGYLPLNSTENGYEYRAVVQVPNQRKLDQYNIKKIGCFPDVAPPKAEVLPEPPLYGWPLYDLIRDPKLHNNLERYTCWNYEQYGIVF